MSEIVQNYEKECNQAEEIAIKMCFLIKNKGLDYNDQDWEIGKCFQV